MLLTDARVTGFSGGQAFDPSATTSTGYYGTWITDHIGRCAGYGYCFYYNGRNIDLAGVCSTSVTRA